MTRVHDSFGTTTHLPDVSHHIDRFGSAEDRLSSEMWLDIPPLKCPGTSDSDLAIYLQMPPCSFDSKGLKHMFIEFS